MPYRWFYCAIVLFCAIGVYSTNNTWDIWLVGLFDVIGYVFIKLSLALAALAGMLLLALLPAIKRQREEAFVEN